MISLGTAVEVKVIKRHPTGGGIITLPVLSAAEIDLARTAGGGEGMLDITIADLEQMARNFVDWPGPVGVNVAPHKTDYEASGPQPAFMEGLSVIGNDLWSTMDIGKELFESIVDKREWRGFSVDIGFNVKKPTKAFEGWSVTRGVFTNNPAAPVNFKVAAEAGGCTVTVPLQSAPSGEEKDMATEEKTISLAAHEAKVAEVRAETTASTERALALEGQLEVERQAVKDMTSERNEANTKLSAMTTDHAALKGTSAVSLAEVSSLRTAKKTLEAKVVELSEKLTETEDANLGIRVKEVISLAIDANVPPAMFDGHEADPATWMKSNYASFEAFQKQTNALAGIVPDDKSAPVKTRTDKSPTDTPTDGPQLSAEDQAKLDGVKKRIGLTTDFSGITTEEEAQKAHEAALAEKK